MPVIPTDFTVGRSPFTAGEIQARISPEAMAVPGQARYQAASEIGREATQWADMYGQALRQKQSSELIFNGMTDLAEAQERWSRHPNSAEAMAGFKADA